MGWLWSPSSPSGGDPRSVNETKNDQESSTFGLSERQRSRIFGTQAPPPPQDDKPSQQTASDKDLESFLQSFSNPSTTTSDSSSQDENTPHPRTLPNGTLDISPSALYPRTMSCRQAFDHAWYCQSPGGKFNDLYRYGRLQSCSEQWDAFWMCMRTRTLSTAVRQESIKEYYEKRDVEKRRKMGSSEDVWEIRTVAVREAFGKDPDAVDGVVEPLVKG